MVERSTLSLELLLKNSKSHSLWMSSVRFFYVVYILPSVVSSFGLTTFVKVLKDVTPLKPTGHQP